MRVSKPVLKSISISGFRSFGLDTQSSTELPDSGLVLLSGKNLDTGGSSGAGKSTVNLAIAYVLGFCPIPSTELGNWNKASTLKVELELAHNGTAIRLKRTTAGLMMWQDGVQVKGGSKAVADALKAMFGLDPDMISLLTYRGQRQPGLFLSMTDSEKKEFLTKVLGLVRFEDATEKTQEGIKALETDLTLVTNKIDILKAQQVDSKLFSELDAFKEALGQEKAKLTEHDKLIAEEKENIVVKEGLFKELLVKVKAKHLELITPARQRFNDVKPVVADYDDTKAQELKKALTECTKRIDALNSDFSTKTNEYKRALASLQKQEKDLDALIAQVPSLQKEKERLLKELEKLSDVSCPTCKQAWDGGAQLRRELDGQAEATNEALEKRLQAAQDLEKVILAIAELKQPEVNPGIQKMMEAKGSLRAALDNETARQRDAQKVAQAEFGSLLGIAKHEIAELALAEANELAELTAIHNENMTNFRAHLIDVEFDRALLSDGISGRTVLLDRMVAAKTQWGGLDRQINDESEKLTAISSKLSAEKDFLALIGREGFLGSIFDEVLEEISDETNAILGAVSNTRHVTIAFKSESTTQKGTIKRSIVPTVNVGGNEASFSSGLSGGMQSVAELAVDLALGEVISRRSGACPGWLILDEAFDGLDDVSKESAMEILSTYATKRLVLVTDHSAQFKAMFTKTVTVNYKDGVSTFQ